MPEALSHIRRCRFGHTFQGSFGFTIESPLAPLQNVLGAAEPPFERRVLERVYKGLEQAQQAVKAGSVEPLSQGYEAGVNANMCDALAEIQASASDMVVEYSINWSPRLRRLYSDETQSQPIRVGPEPPEYLRYASREMRRSEQPKTTLLEGRVTMLKSETPPWEDETKKERAVTLQGRDENGKRMRTRILLLKAEHYKLAAESHLKGYPVAVEGLLERRGKFTRLTNITSLQPGRQLALPLESDADDNPH